VLNNPGDPAVMAIHQPNFTAASLPNVHEALERWRAYAWRKVG